MMAPDSPWTAEQAETVGSGGPRLYHRTDGSAFPAASEQPPTTEEGSVLEFDARSRPALIVPTGEDDLAALDALREIVPDHEVVGVPCPVIGYGGDGIHCVTQQAPRV